MRAFRSRSRVSWEAGSPGRPHTEGDAGSAILTFTVSLSVVSGKVVTVTYATTPNTATAGVDYLPTSGTLTIQPGEPSGIVQVTIQGDLLDEPNESVFLDLSAPTNATVADARGRGVIVDNDAPGAPPVLDFNRDGSPDLVFRNTSTGGNALWYISGVTQIGTTYLAPPADYVTDLNWQIRGVGDFNGHTKPDLVWHHQGDGRLGLWLMDNHVRTATPGFLLLSGGLGEPDLTWKVVGAADMNGDGQLDLVWWNQASFALRIWHMDGNVQIDSVAVSLSASAGWQIVGLADMNADGKPDLVWRDYTTGGIAAWLMNDATVLQTDWLSPNVVSDVNSRIVGVMDMNADAKPDLLWQHTTTGELAVWYLNGLT